MGFVIMRKAVLEARAGTRTRLRWTCTTSTFIWRRPRSGATRRRRTWSRPARRVDQFKDEGGQPARLARYTRNCETLVNGMAELASAPSCPRVQAPIIVTFHARRRGVRLKTFYARTRDRGYILYPGKLTQVETFRVGCIGAIDANEMRNVVSAWGRR